MNLNILSNDIAIDFGTSNTRIYIKGKGLVLDEPSVIAFDSISGEVVAAGSEAEAMLGRTPPSVSAIFPLSGGVICDCTLAEELLKTLLRRACEKTIIKPRIFMAIPCLATDVEARALRDAAVLAGARSVYIMKAPIAAAVGSKCDVMLSRGLMIADIGGGCSDFAAISIGQLASVHSVKTAGNAFTDAVAAYLRDEYSLSAGYLSAEKCKREIACVYPKDNKRTTVCGTDLKTGLPAKLTLSSEELRDALMPTAAILTEALKTAVDAVPSELLGDILEDGILLTGWGASIAGLVTRLHIDTELKLFLAPENEYAVIRGLAALAENIDKLPKDIYKVYHS